MAAAVASLAQNIFLRQRDRLRSDRVDSHDHEENENDGIENEDDVIDDAGEEEEGSFLNDQQPSENNNNTRTQDESESSNTNNEGVQSFVARTTMTLAELEEEVRGRPYRFVLFFLGNITTHSTLILLFRLEQQREVARRRSSACFLFAVFVLFRMWIYAVGSSGT
jgi:hypothetical protein